MQAIKSLPPAIYNHYLVPALKEAVRELGTYATASHHKKVHFVRSSN
jgi:hypothetical protein